MSRASPESSPPRIRIAGILAVAAALVSCAGRAPVLVPPSGGVEAVEGFGSASIQGARAAVKGKFAFLFRRPGSGRVEALDPIGRTAFFVFFQSGRATLVLPSKKVYAEEAPETMMERLLGMSLRPEDMVRLLSGTWTDAGPEGGWKVERDDRGRVASGERDGLAFTIRSFFPGAGVPREIGFSGPGTAGRMKIHGLGFNPPPRPGSFDLSFLRGYTLKTWDEIVELLDR